MMIYVSWIQRGAARARCARSPDEASGPTQSIKTRPKEKPGPEDGPGLVLVVARIKLLKLETVKLEPIYAVLRGRTVRSRTWVRMLDICIPFSCETKGRSSA